MVGKTAVVDKRVFCLYLKVFAEQVVDARLVDYLCRAPFSCRTIKVVAGLSPKFATDDRSHQGKIRTVCPVAELGVQSAVLQVGTLVCPCGESPTGVVDIFRTNLPVGILIWLTCSYTL